MDELQDENDQMNFIKAFRALMGYLNVLVCFREFTFSDLNMKEQTFEDYKSKYLDLHDKVKI